MSRNTKFALTLGFAAVLFTILGYSLFRSIEETSSKKKLQLHTMDVLEEIHSLLMFNFEQESVFRGQLIDPEDDFYVTFTKRKVMFQNSLYQLTNLVSDNPVQLKKIDSLQVLYDLKQSNYNEILFTDTSRIQSLDLKAHIAEINEMSDTFKRICRSMVDLEDDLLENREIQFDEQQLKSKQMLVLIFILTVIIIGIFLFVVARNFIAINKARTELEAKNATLLTLSERLESSLRHAKVAAFDWVDTEKEEFWISNSMFAMLDLPPEDFDATVTGFFTKHMHPDDAPSVQQQLMNHIENGVAYNPEYRLLASSGEYVNFRAIGSTKKTEFGKTRMMGVIMNIEKELVERERYQNLFEYSYEAIFLTNKDLQITEFNSSFKKLMKYNEYGDLRLSRLFPNQEEFNQLKKELQAGSSYSTKVEMKTLAGKMLIANLTCWPVQNEASKGEMSYQGEIHDVTELEQTQQKLIETEKLHLTGRMARIIGHEVRNPLTNIILASEELLHDETDEDGRELLGIVKRNSMRISKLIDDLLNSTKFLELNKSKSVLQEVVSAAIEKCQDRIALKRITLTTIGLDEKSIVLLDREKFQIALVNIIINSTEAMSKTENASLTIAVMENNEGWQISIQDNGCGMSEETKKKIFDPFYTARNGGLGLGMTNVKNILMQHDAQLYLESELEKGTTFFIQLKS